MAQEETAQVDEDTTAQDDVDAGTAGMADAVDDRAAQLTGSDGAAATDAPVSEVNRGAVEKAEEHLDDTNLSDDRETLKNLQKGM
jgi:hypothetical protein